MKTIMKVGRELSQKARENGGKSFMNGTKCIEIQIRGFHPAFVAREGQTLTSIESEE
jgi:hypothetical protein